MSGIAKDQMQRFSPEQQEALAMLETNRVKKRQELLERARDYRGRQSFPPLMACISFMVAFIFATRHEQIVPPYVIGFSLLILIQFHAKGANRRIDALMELLRTDLKDGD
jgi:hypothetical protein